MEQGDGFHTIENCRFFMAFLEVIIRDHETEVVNMMKTDIPCEPLEERRQFKIGAALQGNGFGIPVFVVIPDHIFKLVLDIKHEYAGNGSEVHHRQLYQQILLPSDKITECRGNHQDAEIGQIHGETLFPGEASSCEPIIDKEHEGGTNSKHNERIPIDSVYQSFPLRKSGKLIYCQCPDIPNSSLIKIAGSLVMDQMCMVPAEIRGESQHPDNKTDAIAQPF